MSSLFGNRDVAIDREVRESLDLAAGRRPMDFDKIGVGGGAKPQNLARVVRRKVAAAAVLQARVLSAAGGPSDLRANGVAVALGPYKFNAEPVVPRPGVVSQQHRSTAVVADQNIDAPI